MTKIRKQQVYRVEPVLFDRMQGNCPPAGTEVHIVQPAGCPKNGTMGMVYTQHVESGELIGLLCKGSLVKTGRTAPVRDRAAEAREARRPNYRRTGPSPFTVVGRIEESG
jgi:hypothetical protein